MNKKIMVLLLLIVGCTTQTLEQEQILIPEIASETHSYLEETVTYGDNFKGFLVKSEGEHPGVIMIHEWWGLNDNIKQTARELAQEGYTVLAVDLYDGNVAQTQEEARTYVSAVRTNQTRSLAHLKSAADYLRNNQGVSKLASLGWCFGGGMSLQMSLNESVDATVIYYGTLETNTSVLQQLNSPVLGIFGREDTSIPVESVDEFDNALDLLGIQNEIYVYDGVGHAFANPSNPGHDAEKTADAWQKTVDFLERELKE